MCKHHRRCSARRLLDSKGNPITNHSQFVARAAEVAGLYTGMSIVIPNDVTLASFLSLSEPIWHDWGKAKAAAAGVEFDEDDECRDDVVIDGYRLCGTHGRQLARGTLTALHYQLCFPDSAPPPPKIIWAAGSLTFVTETYFLPSVVALYRAHALDLADEHQIDRSLEGLRECCRKFPEPVDDKAAAPIAGPLMEMAMWLNTGPKGQGGEGFRVIRDYCKDDVPLLTVVVEYLWLWSRIARLPKLNSPPPSPAPTTFPPTPFAVAPVRRFWFTRGF